MKNLLYLLLLLSIVTSCNKKVKSYATSTTEKQTEVSNEELVMYVPSELAALMQEMYAVNQDWKSEILDGNIPENFPERFKTIHTATSTNENAGKPFYNAMAISYMNAVDAVTRSTPDNVVENFNMMVNVCVACHGQVCPGPIERIEKLLIK